jgi:DNA-binding transcriptional regulator GbsR (MarR family)
LQALAERANPTLAELSEAIGRSEGCVSTRLNKLQTQGLALSPQCVPGRSWCLSQAGRAAVQAGHPVVVLDQRDCDILRIIARALAGIVAIARRVEVCNLTARRRADLLVAQKLAKADERRRYVVTDEGRKALGDSAPQPWVRMEMVSAANARDVHRRMEHPNDDRTAAERSKQGSEARAKALQTTQANKAAPFNAFPDWLLTG